MRLKYFYIIVFLIWLCIFIALLPTHRISAILEALDFSDKNLTQREIVELNLKDYLKKLHYLDNYPQIDFGKMADIHLDKNGYERVRFSWCNGDKYPDDRCEFWKLDKRLNFDYLMDLGSKICKNGKPIENAEEIVKNDEILKLRLFYPWEQKHLIDEDGNFIENFIYMRFGDGAFNQLGLFTDFVFTNKMNIRSLFNENKDIKFNIIITNKSCYHALLEPIFKNLLIGDKKADIESFCYNYIHIKNKINWFNNKEKIDCDHSYFFYYIPIYKKKKMSEKDVLSDSHVFFYKDIETLFKQYQNLKNQKNKINFNSQGEDNGTESK